MSSLGFVNPPRLRARTYTLPTPVTCPTNEEEQSVSRPIVLGAMDGLITSFVIVASAYAGSVDMRSTAIIGVASLLADGVSMGISEWLSVRGFAERRRAVRLALACFGGFLVGGIPPLVAFVAWKQVSTESFVTSVIVYCLTLVLVAYMRASFFDNLTRVQSLVEVLTLGGLAGGIAFGIAGLASLV